MVDLLFALFIWANRIPRIENKRGFLDVFPRLATKEIPPVESHVAVSRTSPTAGYSS